MFSCEIRINGNMVSHINVHETSETNPVTGASLYRYELCKNGSGVVATGSIYHHPHDGRVLLFQRILNVVGDPEQGTA